MTNRQRVNKAANALRPYEDHADLKSPIVDLLTDLRHYCRKHDLDLDDLARISADHFAAETAAKPTA